MLFDSITQHALFSLSVLTLSSSFCLYLHLHYMLIDALFQVIHAVWTGGHAQGLFVGVHELYVSASW